MVTERLVVTALVTTQVTTPGYHPEAAGKATFYRALQGLWIGAVGGNLWVVTQIFCLSVARSRASAPCIQNRPGRTRVSVCNRPRAAHLSMTEIYPDPTDFVRAKSVWQTSFSLLLTCSHREPWQSRESASACRGPFVR